jgi:hypothetical protein
LFRVKFGKLFVKKLKVNLEYWRYIIKKIRMKFLRKMKYKCKLFFVLKLKVKLLLDFYQKKRMLWLQFEVLDFKWDLFRWLIVELCFQIKVQISLIIIFNFKHLISWNVRILCFLLIIYKIWKIKLIRIRL